MLSNLENLLEIGRKNGYAIAAFNVFGFEDAWAVSKAAEERGKPVILMANRNAVAHIPVDILGDILLKVARRSTVPVCVHLDHALTIEAIEEAVAAGFTSVMLDASQLPLEENIAETNRVVGFAHPHGVSVESEIGAVGYSDPSIPFRAEYTDPKTAKYFAEATRVDALAISIGNVHRMITQSVHLQFDRLEKINSLVKIPLVLHGSTGVTDDELVRAVRGGIQKVNPGTTLRMAFGNTLRKEMAENPQEFDRIELFKGCMEAVRERAEEKIRLLSFSDAQEI